MKTTTHHLKRAIGLGAVLLCASPLMGQNLVGQWDFDKGDLTATAGFDLGYADGPGGPTALGTQFGTTTALGVPKINGADAAVMKFPAATNNMGFLMYAPPTPNGGGSLVNEWSLVMDVLYPGTSSGVARPIIDTDGNANIAGPEIVVSASGGVGVPPSGPYVGQLVANTWYRLGLAANNSGISVYLNGSPVGTLPGYALDGRFAMSPSLQTLIFGDTITTNAAVGYVNSLQLWDATLNAGQMLALGGPSAAGMPTNIPPVPAFVQSRSPGVNATGVFLSPSIDVVLNQGSTTVDSSSIQLSFDGSVVPATITATAPTFEVKYSVTNFLDPNSIHALSLVWKDSVAGTTTNSWTFTVSDYQNVILPTPFYFENFDELAESVTGPTPLPPGWTVQNQSWPPTSSGFNLDAFGSDSYKDWVLITADREFSWGGPPVNEPGDRLAMPPIVLNGALLSVSNFISGNLMWAESDQLCGGCWGQYQEMYTGDIDCTGRTNVFVAFHSFYEQNQDNMNLCEYSVDQGTNWLPVRYMFCALGNGESSDIIYTNDAKGNSVVDVGQTFSRIDNNRNWAPWPAGCTDTATCPPYATNYGSYLKAPISAALIPYIKGYTNDDTQSSKEIIIVRLAQADGQKHVRFRFLDDGTSSWFWGIDNFGLYEINTPVITTQPQSQSVDAGTPATLTVVASSSSPATYQWKFGGVNIAGATNSSYTIPSVAPNNAGQYQVVVSNSDGPVKSSLATLTVVTTPAILTQPASQVADAGDTVTIGTSTRGGRPLTYLWLSGSGAVPGGTSESLTLASVQPVNSGLYKLVITNSYGAITSAVAELTVVAGPITNNLVVHLPFDGNLTDTSGRGNNAAYAHNGSSASTTPTFTGGKIGQAFEYTTLKDGSKIEYATLGYPDDLKFGSTTSFSMSFWINYTNQDDDPPFISNKDWSSSNKQGWGIFTQGGGNFRLNVTGPNGSSDKFSVTLSPVLRDGSWHNLVTTFVRSSSSPAGYVYTYVDGTLVDKSTMVVNGSVDTAGLTFGNSQGPNGSALPDNQTDWAVNIGQDGTGVYIDGGSAFNIGAKIDDVGIWRRALTAHEAAAIYTAGQSGKDLAQAVVSSGPSKVTIHVSASNGNLVLTWAGAPTVKLQTASSLTSPNWTDVPSTLGASSANIPTTGSAAFFRLSQ